MTIQSLALALALALALLGCGNEPAALTREESAVLQAAVVDLESSHPELERELRQLRRALKKGTAEELRMATSRIRTAAKTTIDDALTLVLDQVETAAR